MHLIVQERQAALRKRKAQLLYEDEFSQPASLVDDLVQELDLPRRAEGDYEFSMEWHNGAMHIRARPKTQGLLAYLMDSDETIHYSDAREATTESPVIPGARSRKN